MASASAASRRLWRLRLPGTGEAFELSEEREAMVYQGTRSATGAEGLLRPEQVTARRTRKTESAAEKGDVRRRSVARDRFGRSVPTKVKAKPFRETNAS